MALYLNGAHAGRYIQSLCTTCWNGCIFPGTIHGRVRCVHASSSARSSPAVRASCERLAPPFVCLLLAGAGALRALCVERQEGTPPRCDLPAFCTLPAIPQSATPSRLHVITSGQLLSSLFLSPRLLTPSRPWPPWPTTKSKHTTTRSIRRRRMDWTLGAFHHGPLPACTALLVNLPCSILLSSD